MDFATELLKIVNVDLVARGIAPISAERMAKESDYLRSDYCTQCGGCGELEGEQCLNCEDLHYAEVMADRMVDEAKEYL